LRGLLYREAAIARFLATVSVGRCRQAALLGLMFLRAAVAIGSRATPWGHAIIWLDLPVYIYIYRERERERFNLEYIILYIYIYIFIRAI
jgi:hypothetical protein